MFDGTPLRAGAERLLRRVLEALDRKLFLSVDLDATARGWHVHRSQLFRRTYRDPRWDLVSRCADCDGSGKVGASACDPCTGTGTVRSNARERCRLP